MTALKSALEAYKPEIAEAFRRIVRGQFAGMVRDHGPDLKGISNSYRWARAWNNTVRAHVRKVGGDFAGRGGTFEIVAERLEPAATAYADSVVQEWEAKITAKLGELDGAEVRSLDSCQFAITGKRNGRSVRIIQTMIVNVSAKGTLFNQFPARIYVDGKFMSEAKFKKLANEVRA